MANYCAELQDERTQKVSSRQTGLDCPRGALGSFMAGKIQIVVALELSHFEKEQAGGQLGRLTPIVSCLLMRTQ